MRRKEKREGRTAKDLKKIPYKSLRMALIFFVLLVLLFTVLVTAAIYILLDVFFPKVTQYAMVSTVATLIAIAVIGTVLSAVISNRFLLPLQEMINATDKISKGDFKVHIEESFDEDTEVGMLQRQFNHMARELDSIEMFRKDFINNFSHEFKTPIVSVRGFAHQLQQGNLSEAETREYIDIIASESDRLVKMATNVLLLSKLENQQIVTDRTPFELDEQIRTCILLLEKQWTEKEIELEVELDPVTFCFNENMLSEVWINLVGNAIKFTPPYGKITCTLRRENGKIIATVSDTGRGMSEAEMAHIFEKFYQGDQSHSGDGNGIGLTIVGRILELCGGEIRVESCLGQGTTFTVLLPTEDHA